jgi:hypothetical protein
VHERKIMKASNWSNGMMESCGGKVRINRMTKESLLLKKPLFQCSTLSLFQSSLCGGLE